jgi:hypothetical protein
VLTLVQGMMDCNICSQVQLQGRPLFQKRQGPPAKGWSDTWILVVTDDTREAKEKLEMEVTPLTLRLLFFKAIWGSSNGMVQEMVVYLCCMSRRSNIFC